ncbi:HK97 gp10 family phage protein [Budviciaceae bacterium CWB-B4]|uniref:HK97 gp10 family phage protein n=1 Tax=Limnobaculum xujianqingii TaxID=2738837 RepID=A0A9D7AKN2_9GAMM|nr:HK97 gp10 family phage protein [Limnobaculum xujianqingii]MBK5074601.1 HK97 gp10 family phage protein [Limnobaculum xujianqingii]MBK5177733.1 HK97 gp10 family phage protein [Limnobaculum xujianqingii]
MSIKVKGVKEARRNLDALIGNIVGRKAVRAVTKALVMGGSLAAVYTPIDTSTLINSQVRDIQFNGQRLTGRVIYAANYATYVHDPNNPQKFRRSGAKKEFLKKGFEEQRAQIDAAVWEEMRL